MNTRLIPPVNHHRTSQYPQHFAERKPNKTGPVGLSLLLLLLLAVFL